jgi:hypothetical protein
MIAMTDHAIKRERARRLCPVGRYPETYAALSAHLPERLVERLSARDLADVIEAFDLVSSTGKALADREAVANGCVWNARAGRLVEIVTGIPRPY